MMAKLYLAGHKGRTSFCLRYTAIWWISKGASGRGSTSSELGLSELAVERLLSLGKATSCVYSQLIFSLTLYSQSG